MLLLDAAGPLTVLPTHRVVRGLGDDRTWRALRPGLPELFDVDRRRRPQTLVARFEAAGALAGGGGRLAC